MDLSQIHHSHLCRETFSLETALFLVSGVLGARLVTDQSWISQGLAIGGINRITSIVGDSLLNDTDYRLMQKVIPFAFTLIAALAIESTKPSSLNLKVIGSASACNVTSILVYSYFFEAHQVKFIGFSLDGKLTLPKPHFFTTDYKLFSGFMSYGMDENGSTWGCKEQEDCYFYSHFPQKNLVRRDGTFLEECAGSIDSIPYVVMESIEFSSHEDATVQLEEAVSHFLNTHHSLPQKLIIPFGGCTHTSCLIIEPKNETSCTITALDSLASMGFGRREAVAGVENALKNRFDSVSITYNQWSQNNLMRCATHVMLNVTIVSEYSGSVYKLVTKANEDNSIPDQLKSRSEQELIDAYKVISDEICAVFEETCKLNPNKVIVRLTDGNYYIESLMDLSN